MTSRKVSKPVTKWVVERSGSLTCEKRFGASDRRFQIVEGKMRYVLQNISRKSKGEVAKSYTSSSCFPLTQQEL